MLNFSSAKIVLSYFENLNLLMSVISVNLRRWFTDRNQQSWASEFYTADFFY